jgi:methanogenic corrinoid protein MtbC1
VAIETHLPQLQELIAHFRQSSGNPHIKVMLGGPIFTLKDLSADMFGADAISTDPVEAVNLLKSFAVK